MTRLGRWLIVFWVAVAIWVSDRWLWPMSALLGVAAGTAISHIQREHFRRGTPGLPPFEWGSLLVITSFLYLYVLFLALDFGDTDTAASFGLLVGAIALPLLLIGLLAALVWKVKLPRWLSKLWDQLLHER